MPGIDTDPDRHALDADPDPDPQRCLHVKKRTESSHM